MPTIWGAVKKKLYSVHNSPVVIQHYSMAMKTAQLWGSPGAQGPWGQAPLWLDSSALLLAGLLCIVLACSALLHQDIFHVSAQPGRQSLWWKGKLHFQSWREAGLYGQKSPPLVPDWSVLMQMRAPNPQFGQNRATLVEYSWVAPIIWGKPQSYQLK